MKVKMNETYQAVGLSALLVKEYKEGEEPARVSVLEAGEVYEVDATTAAYLIENNKAVEFQAAKAEKSKAVVEEKEEEPVNVPHISEVDSGEEPFMSTKKKVKK